MPRSLGTRGAGNFNLKGKKSHLCACRCCVVQDFREDYESQRVANEEIRTATIEDGNLEWSENYQYRQYRWRPADDGLVDSRERDDHDRGDWSIFTQKKGEIGIISSDFEHDVVLYVNGDFADDETKMEYAKLIAERLNRTIPR